MGEIIVTVGLGTCLNPIKQKADVRYGYKNRQDSARHLEWLHCASLVLDGLGLDRSIVKDMWGSTEYPNSRILMRECCYLRACFGSQGF